MAITKMSNLGIASLGSEKYNDMLAGNAAYLPSSFESIASTTVGVGGSSFVEFTSIPSTYKHLHIRIFARDTYSAAGPYYAPIQIQFNGDTSRANYTLTRLSATMAAGASSVLSTAGWGTGSYGWLRAWSGYAINTNANIFGAAAIDLIEYASTTKLKTMRAVGSVMQLTTADGSAGFSQSSGVWNSTSAITSIKFTPDYTAFAQNSIFALYGIKG
jgi:hypothetical protein